MRTSVSMEGSRETLAAFRRLPRDASRELRQKSRDLVSTLVPRVSRAAESDRSPQSKLLGPTVKPKSDRVPAIQVGGSKRVGSRGVPAYSLLFGAEFGSNRFAQFHKSHTGKTGSWFFPAVEKEAPEVTRAWKAAADATIRKFSS